MPSQIADKDSEEDCSVKTMRKLMLERKRLATGFCVKLSLSVKFEITVSFGVVIVFTIF